MSGSSSPGSSRGQVDDAALLPIDEYIKTLEELVLRLKTDHEARRLAPDSAESEPALLEEHAASINNFTTDLSLLQSLQLADEQVKLLMEEDSELLDLCAENQRICKEVIKKRQALDKANATISKLKSVYHSCIDRRFSSNTKPDRGGKPSLKENRELQDERHKLKVLNNVLLQVITSAGIDWAKNEQLVGLLNKISKFL
ncbi:hypothetical protein MTO96_000060 [Rhipicephalus appendiculatus]